MAQVTLASSVFLEPYMVLKCSIYGTEFLLNLAFFMQNASSVSRPVPFHKKQLSPTYSSELKAPLNVILRIIRFLFR